MVELIDDGLNFSFPEVHPQGTVKLTKSSSSDPQDTGLEPVANPPCWGSETAVSLNLTIPPRHTFHLHRKETEGRYNHRQAHTYQTPLRYLRENPLN